MIEAQAALEEASFPAMESHFQTSLSIPFFSSMEEADVDRVAAALRATLFLRMAHHQR